MDGVGLAGLSLVKGERSMRFENDGSFHTLLTPLTTLRRDRKTARSSPKFEREREGERELLTSSSSS